MKFTWLSRGVGRLPVWGWTVIGLVVIAVGVSASSSQQSPEIRATDETIATTSTRPPATSTTKPRPTTTTRPATTTTTLPVIGSGTYIVGTDIAPGGYRIAGYFARLDANMEIIDNDGVYDSSGLTYVVVEPSDAYLEVSGEAIAIEDFPVFDPLLVAATEGTYLVNVDIQPGRYRVEDPTYAYAARLSCDRDIIDNEGNEGNVIIIVKVSDCLFMYSGTLTRID
jgi:hypothetical protein